MKNSNKVNIKINDEYFCLHQNEFWYFKNMLNDIIQYYKTNNNKLKNVIIKIPGTGKYKVINHQIAIINSMTKKERANPDLIKASRKIRISNGSGTRVQDVNKLLKQFLQSQKMMKKMKSMGRDGLPNDFMQKLQGKLPSNFN